MTTLIYGPPCGGKTDLVRQLRIRGDLVLDFDQVHSALSGLDLHDHHDAITPFVLDAIKAITRRLQVDNYDRAWLIAGAPSRAARSEFSSFTNQTRLVYADRATCHERAATAGRPDAWHTYIDSWHDAYEPDLPERSDPMPIERRTADEGVELREEGDTIRRRKNRCGRKGSSSSFAAAFGWLFCFFSPEQRPARPHAALSDAPPAHNADES